MDPQHGPDIEGMQVEVDPAVGKHTGGLYESGGRGWVIMPTTEGEQALKSGEWNDLEVSVEGNHIVTRLNGVKIVDYTDAAPKFTDGVVALQIHTGGGVRMRWKEIFYHKTARAIHYHEQTEPSWLSSDFRRGFGSWPEPGSACHFAG